MLSRTRSQRAYFVLSTVNFRLFFERISVQSFFLGNLLNNLCLLRISKVMVLRLHMSLQVLPQLILDLINRTYQFVISHNEILTRVVVHVLAHLSSIMKLLLQW